MMCACSSASSPTTTSAAPRYLIGDEDAGVAAVVDPRLDIDEYLRLARYLGRARSSTSSRRTTTPTTCPATAGWRPPPARRSTSTATPAPDYEHEPFDDGWELELGALRVRALHTPGHRPEHTAFALIDTRARRRAVGGADRRLAVRRRHRPARPRGRQGGGRARHLPLAARAAAHAARRRCEVWPGHLGGSLCGGPGMDLKVSSTIGFERAHSALLQIDDEDEFVAPRDRARSARSRRTSEHRRAQPRPARRGERRRAPAHAAPGRSRRATTARWSSTSAPSCSSTRRTSPAPSCITARRAGFGSKLAWLAEPRPAARARRPRRRGRARGRRARRRGRPARRSPATSPAA